MCKYNCDCNCYTLTKSRAKRRNRLMKANDHSALNWQTALKPVKNLQEHSKNFL